MELKFQTKEESNRQQEEAYLKLSKSERVWLFFEMMQKSKTFPLRKNLPSPVTLSSLFNCND